MDLSPRVRAVCDLDVARAREYAGRHEYDGKTQDLSPAGVRAGLARLEAARSGTGPLPDPHDEAHLSAAEELKRVTFARLELHRRNPLSHLGELDLSCYDRDYAPREERDAAGRDRRHAVLADSRAGVGPAPESRPALDVARELVRDHPDGGAVIESARIWTERAIEFTRDHDLVPYHDGVCLVGPAPESRRWSVAMLSWAAPGEPEGPSWYPITPPE